MNSLKKGEGVPLLNFVGGPEVPLLNFEGVLGVPLLNFRGVPGPRVLVPLLHHAINNTINWNNTMSSLWGQSNEKVL